MDALKMNSWFYFLGFLLFAIGSIGNLWGLSIHWDILDMAGKISSVSGLFIIVLAIYFFILWKNNIKFMKDQKLAEKEIDDIAKEALKEKSDEKLG
jgi:hypothetical protein